MNHSLFNPISTKLEKEIRFSGNSKFFFNVVYHIKLFLPMKRDLIFVGEISI